MTEQEFVDACKAATGGHQMMAGALASFDWAALYAKVIAAGKSLQKVLTLLEAIESKDWTKIVALLADLIPAPTPAP